jgi:hypothetical protein
MQALAKEGPLVNGINLHVKTATSEGGNQGVGPRREVLVGVPVLRATGRRPMLKRLNHNWPMRGYTSYRSLSTLLGTSAFQFHWPAQPHWLRTWDLGSWVVSPRLSRHAILAMIGSEAQAGNSVSFGLNQQQSCVQIRLQKCNNAIFLIQTTVSILSQRPRGDASLSAFQHR